MKSGRIAKLSSLVLALLLVFGSSILADDQGQGSEAKKQATKTAPKKSKTTKAYTNADLDRMFGRSARARPAPSQPDNSSEPPEPGQAAEAAPLTPLEQLFEQERVAHQLEKDIAKATERVAEAQKRISDLEKRSLAVTNPFLPRPEAPEEGRDEWDAADTQGRLEQNEKQLDSARQDLVKAQEELVALRGY